MRLFFIRHAPTEANTTGKIVKDYNSYGIISLTDEQRYYWNINIGKNLPKQVKILCSPQRRCEETVIELFGKSTSYEVTDLLDEFDCSNIGERKFWEMSEEDFNTVTGFTREKLDLRIKLLFDEISGKYTTDSNIVLITHGFYTRVVYAYLTNSNDSPFDIICSKNFQFSNLDMMEVDNGIIKNIWKFNIHS